MDFGVFPRFSGKTMFKPCLDHLNRGFTSATPSWSPGCESCQPHLSGRFHPGWVRQIFWGTPLKNTKGQITIDQRCLNPNDDVDVDFDVDVGVPLVVNTGNCMQVSDKDICKCETLPWSQAFPLMPLQQERQAQPQAQDPVRHTGTPFICWGTYRRQRCRYTIQYMYILYTYDYVCIYVSVYIYIFIIICIYNTYTFSWTWPCTD